MISLRPLRAFSLCVLRVKLYHAKHAKIFRKAREDDFSAISACFFSLRPLRENRFYKLLTILCIPSFNNLVLKFISSANFLSDNFA